MSKKSLLILVLVSFFTSVLRAEWQESGAQYTSYAIDVSAQVDERDSLKVFVADSCYRLYRSSDQGITWEIITHEKSHNPSCVLQISGTDRVYIGRYEDIDWDSAGVFRSNDNGDNWFLLSDPGSGLLNRKVLVLTYSSFDTSYMLAGCDTAYEDGSEPITNHSWDSGYNWEMLIRDIDPKGDCPSDGLCAIFDIMYIPEETTYAYEAAGRCEDAGIRRIEISGDDGSCWLRLSGDTRSLAIGGWDDSVQTLYAGIYSGDSAGVWVTADSGVNWDSLSGTMGYAITAIAVDPTSIDDTLLSNDTLYVGTDGDGIQRSTDGGSNWSFVNSGIHCKSILDIKVDPVNNNRVYAGAQWSFYVSTDYGQSWTEQIQGMKKAQISGVASNAPTKYCIGEFDNLYKSTDGGSNWTTIHAFEAKPGFEGSDHIRAKLLTVNQHNPDKLFASVYAPTSAGGYDNDRIWRSTDGGSNWEVVLVTTVSNLMATSLVIDPQDSNIIYATYDAPTDTFKVMRNTSGGHFSDWVAKVSGLPNDGVLCLAVNPAYNNLLYVGTKANGIYKNVEAGEIDTSWIQIGLSGEKVRSIVINPGDVDEIFAGCTTGVYKSTDGGSNWTLMDNGMTHTDVYSLAIKPHVNPVVYAACLDDNDSGHVYESTNGGTSWTEIDSGLPTDWVVFADDVPYINLQIDTVAFASHVLLGTKKGLFKYEMSSYSGHITANTNWGPGTVFMDGDVTVDSSVTLNIDSNATVQIKPESDGEGEGADTLKCDLIVFGSLNANGVPGDSIKFLSFASAPSDSDWQGITVNSSGDARLNYCDIRYAYTAFYDKGSAHDSVTHCRFKNNFMHAIKTENSNLLIDSCVIENDSVGGSDETYGILCYKSSPTIRYTMIKNYEYGIKCDGDFLVGSSPSIEECGFYNIGETGIWCKINSDATIEKSCFKGDFGKTCIQVDMMADPVISKCYMASEGSGIPIGMFFNGGGGTVRRSTFFDYDSCAIEIFSMASNPDFGTVDSAGRNYFERTDTYYIISGSGSTVKAESCYWESEDSIAIDTMITGNVDFSPWFDVCSPPIPYYPDICSDLPPDDPTITPCKIVTTPEGNLPKSFAVSQNYPNPFNPQTVIKYDLPEASHVKIGIYNILGQKVKTLVNEDQQAGCKSVNWDGKDYLGKDVASGIYFYRIEAGEFSMVKKMVLLK